MRRLLKMAMVVAMLAGAIGARAQLIDPSTGFTVNAASDPMDFSAIASGQPGNAGMEAGAAAMDSMNALMAQQAAAQQQAEYDAQQAQTTQDFQNFVNSTSQSNSNDDDSTPAVPAVPKTAKPKMSPNGGKVVAGTLVTLSDADRDALLFYTTDGSKPTTSSAKYTAPIVVNTKEKVRALAFDEDDQPSGVVSKTFKLKG